MMMKISLIVAFWFCLIALARSEKELECEVKQNTSFAQFDELFTACTLRNVNYITGKGLHFSNATNDIAYNNLRITFMDSHAETIPQIFYTFTNLEILQMNNVGLRNIFTSSFQRASNLRVFHAYGNKITQLDAHAFVEAPKLEYLDLSRNKISNIHVSTFRGLRYLKELSLIDNKISIISEDTFAPLRNLTWIWLDKNELKVISLNLFINNNKLIGLNLNDNSIAAFSTVLLDKLPSLNYLFLQGNNCTSSSFVNTVIAQNTNIKLQLSTCYQEYRLIVPNEEERHQLKNVLRDAEKANVQCETDKAKLITHLESTKQQLASLQNKNGK